MLVLSNKNKIAMIIGEQKISYLDAINNIKYISTLIEIKEKSHNLIFMENRPEYAYSIYSVWDNNAVAVCIDASSTFSEFEYYLINSDSERVFTSDKNVDLVEKVIRKLNKEHEIEIINVDKINFGKYEHNGKLTVEVNDINSIAIIIYTSGTTGNPKGVMISFKNIQFQIEALDVHNMFLESDVFLTLLPLHHILPLAGTLIVPLIKGSTLVFLKDLTSQTLIDAMKKYKVTVMIGVPKLWELMHKKIIDKINEKKFTKFLFNTAQKINCNFLNKILFKKVREQFGGNIRFFVSGGSKLNPIVTKDFYTFGIKVCEGYGLSESSPLISYTPYTDIRPGSAGKIIKNCEVKITAEGEIIARGENFTNGYYKNEEETKKAFDEEGFFHTGDLGEIKDGFLYVTGRIKEMIVLANGKNINPIEIENKIFERANLIKEIAIIDNNGILTAVIYPDFQKIYDLEIKNIKETIKYDVIDSYNKNSVDYKKVLDVIIVKEELPKTKIGKLRRFKLKEFISKQDEEVKEIEEPKFEEYNILKDYLINIKNKKISPKAHIELDIGLDSLDMVEFIYFLESKFGIKDKEVVMKYPIVQDLAEYIQKNNNGEIFSITNWQEILNEKFDGDFPKSNIVSIILKPLMFLIFKTFLPLQIKGKENIIKKPAIYIGNHESFLDAFILNYCLSNSILKNTYYIAKTAHFKSGLMKFFARNSNTVLVDLNKDIAAVLKTSAEILRRGKNIVIFPEGTRTRNGKLGDFKKSFAILAKEMNVDLQIFVINGAYEAFPANKKFPKHSKINIEFLKRINLSDLSYDEIISESKSKIENKLK